MQGTETFNIGRPGGIGGMTSSADWRWAPIKTVAEYSPQVAMARYLKIPFAPFLQPIVATFQNTTDTVGPFSFANSNDRLPLVSIVDQVMLQVDAPTYNFGNALKPFIDFFFARQTGVQATMTVEGSPRYVVSPNFIPIASLITMLTESWPMGWILGYTQTPRMQFATSFALPAVPVTFTCTFRMWQPTITGPMMNMTDNRAVEFLVGKGVLTADEAAQFACGRT